MFIHHLFKLHLHGNLKRTIAIIFTVNLTYITRIIKYQLRERREEQNMKFEVLSC